MSSLLALPATTALGDPTAPTHVVGIYAEGANADKVRDQIASTLPPSVKVVPQGELAAAMGKEGQSVPVASALAFPVSKKAALGRFAKVAADVGAEAIIVAVVGVKAGVGPQARVLYVKAGASDADIDSTQTVDGNFAGNVKTALAPDVGPLGATSAPGTTPPSATTPSTTPSSTAPSTTPAAPATDANGKPVRPPNTHGREIVDAFLAFDLGGRNFNYHDPLSKNLRTYSVFGAPGIAFWAGVYPMAMLDIPVIQNIGVVGGAQGAVALSSKASDGTVLTTKWNREAIGLRLRQPLAKQVQKGDRAVVLGVSGTFGHDAFTLSAPGAVGNEAPTVQYDFLRIGLDANFPLGPVVMFAKGGYLGALNLAHYTGTPVVPGNDPTGHNADSPGTVYTRFRSSHIGGIDIDAGLTVAIALGFEARLTAEYIRWFYAFTPTPGDTWVAGGALDQYVHLELGPAYVF